MTAAEALQRIIDDMGSLKGTIDELKASIQLIEANIKTLNNRAAGLMTSTKPVGLADQQTMPSDTPQAVLPSIHSSKQVAAPIQAYKKVFGTLLNNADEPIENVLIKVYDGNNEVCATTETDPIGRWEIMVKPGRYVAEYVKAGFKTVNKTFDVSKNVKEVEVR